VLDEEKHFSMNETATSIVNMAVIAVLWLAWSFFSETRHNHGFWVALLMPLVLIIMPMSWIIFIFVNYSSYILFLIRGRREQHDEFMRKVKTRSGIFLFFN